MKDVQSQPDSRRMPIDKVGVKNIRYPITVLDRANGTQNTVANINMYVNLPHQHKGTHMSRFLEVLSQHQGNINLRNLRQLLEDMKIRLEAESAHIEVEFPYFISKKAPVSGANSLMEYEVAYRGKLDSEGMDLVVELGVPVTTLCPCSKEISQGGAHNQRGMVRVAMRLDRFIWIEDIISVIEECASCEVFALLKREDEKYVTETAYDNPMFVEDVVREVAVKLVADPIITWFAVSSENFESIHNHSAYAFIERDKRGQE